MTTEEDKEHRLAIANNLGDIVEGIFLQRQGFESIPIHEEASSSLTKCLNFENVISKELMTQFTYAKITSGRFFCEKILLGHGGKSYAETYPEQLEIQNEFLRLVKAKENESIKQEFVISKSIKKSFVNNCVKQTIKMRFPDFKIDNKAFGSIGFSKKWGQNKLYIIADTGSWRTSISFMLGLNYPKFCMDVAAFFADHQSHYGEGYLSIEQIENDTNKALDLVEAVLPHFMTAIEQALTKKQ